MAPIGRTEFCYQRMIVEQLYALITGYSKLTSRIKRAWLAQFDSWTPRQFRAQFKGLAECGGFLEIEKTFGCYCRWRVINLRYNYILLLLQCCIEVRQKLHKNKYFVYILSHNHRRLNSISKHIKYVKIITNKKEKRFTNLSKKEVGNFQQI